MSDLPIDPLESEFRLEEGLSEFNSSDFDAAWETRPDNRTEITERESAGGRRGGYNGAGSPRKGRTNSRTDIYVGEDQREQSEREQSSLTGNDSAGPNARNIAKGTERKSESGYSRLTPQSSPSRPSQSGIQRDNSDGRYGERISDRFSEPDGMDQQNSTTTTPGFNAARRIASGPKTLSDLQNPLQRAPEFEKAVFEAQVLEAKYMADGQFVIRLAVPTSQGCDEAQKLGKAFGIMLQVGVYRKRYARSHPEEIDH